MKGASFEENTALQSARIGMTCRLHLSWNNMHSCTSDLEA